MAHAISHENPLQIRSVRSARLATELTKRVAIIVICRKMEEKEI
jgi:hypothetical protein